MSAATLPRDQQEYKEIPLKSLELWDGNVRTVDTNDPEVEQLAASIASVGLLQPLIVKPLKAGKFAVVAGGRRLQGLRILAERKVLPKTYPVRCVVREDHTDASLTEISLAENRQRKPMHPADESEAFHKLYSLGKPVQEIAADFGVSEKTVYRRLALAKVHPDLIRQYRAGDMKLDVLQAFTITDNQQQQLEVWERVEKWERNQANRIRAKVSEASVRDDDKRVLFVGLAAYRAAGGEVVTDLFGEEIYLFDPALLDRLAAESLDTIRESVLAEGWRWCLASVEFNSELDRSCIRVTRPARELTEEEADAFRALQAEANALRAQLVTPVEHDFLGVVEDEGETGEKDLEYDVDPGLEDDEESEEAPTPEELRLREVEEQLRELSNQARYAAWPEEIKAHCGVHLYLDHQGKVVVLRGLLRQEDREMLKELYVDDPELQATFPDLGRRLEWRAGPAEDAKPKEPYSAALLESLTGYKTQAVAADLIQHPVVALAAVCHAFLLSLFHEELNLWTTRTACQITLSEPANLSGVEEPEYPAHTKVQEQRQSWLSALKTVHPDELFQTLLTLPEGSLLELLAFCAASSVDGIQRRYDPNGYQEQRLVSVNRLAIALGSDPRPWGFIPTAKNYFSRITREQIVAAMTECGKYNEQIHGKLKKKELAAAAEAAMRDTTWLPEPMRIARPPGEKRPVYKGPDREVVDAEFYDPGVDEEYGEEPLEDE